MAERRSLSTELALQWAFATEKAQMVRPGVIEPEEHRPGVGTEYVLLQRHRLGGVTIDISPGRSHPHDDAELIAETVAHLPAELGGWRMAAWVATYARTGTQPDAMVGEVPRLQPRAWKTQRRGVTDTTAWAYTIKLRHPRNRRRFIRRNVVSMVEYTPCSWRPDAREIEDARRHYAAWRAALLDVRDRLRGEARLTRIEVTLALPDPAPWTRESRPARAARSRRASRA